MKVFIASNDDSDERRLSAAKDYLIQKFNISQDDFVYSNPDVIWFLTGGSEHNALNLIRSKNRYCFIASSRDNSWAAATEVKALLNEKGINTKIFDIDKLVSFDELSKFLKEVDNNKHIKLGLIGGVSDWLVASTPDVELLNEILNIEVSEFSWDYLLSLPEGKNDYGFANTYEKFNYSSYKNDLSLIRKLNTLIEQNQLDAINVACFNLIKKLDSTICLPVAALNNANISATCEGDLCSAAGMVVLSRLIGKIPWMANLSHVDKNGATFSHCTIHEKMLDSMSVTTHFESGKNAAVRGVLKKGEVTIFRIDRKMEYCFLSLGEVVDNFDSPNACRTQAYVKMTSKGLFLLREFPLGNHHLIIQGDCTDIIAEYFTNQGFRIV